LDVVLGPNENTQEECTVTKPRSRLDTRRVVAPVEKKEEEEKKIETVLRRAGCEGGMTKILFVK
jgi:hypothetical protein